MIQSKKDYQEELDRQLRDRDTYQKLPSNPIVGYKGDLANLIEKGMAKGLLNKK